MPPPGVSVPRGGRSGDLSGAAGGDQRELIRPMLATLARELPPDGQRWAAEFTWDGMRAILAEAIMRKPRTAGAHAAVTTIVMPSRRRGLPAPALRPAGPVRARELPAACAADREPALDRDGRVRLREPCPHLPGSGVPEVVEDGKSFLPGRAGLLRAAGVLQVVAELGQRLGQEVLVAEVTEHAHAAAVAVEGLVMPAELVAGGAEA